MSKRTVRRPPGHTGPIVTKGRHLHVGFCPSCGGPTMEVQHQGKPARQCQRCHSFITSKPF